MEAYEVTQVLMTVGTVYHVRSSRTPGALFVIKGEMMASTPKFHMLAHDGTEAESEAKSVADLSANFIKTKYEVHADDALVSTVTFPAVAFKKTMTLQVGENAYEADGGVFKGAFRFKKEDGTVVLEIAKELSIRDTFLVKPSDAIPLPVAFLTAVAIHSRFYDM